MNIIHTGGTYRIFGEGVETFDHLPLRTYAIRFEKMTGFFLEPYTLRSGAGEKIYGKHIEKTDKIMRTYASSNRSLGVILSGEKGIGKSLFARILSEKARAAGMPTILIKEYNTGLDSFIESIDQEAMFLFDEFEKTFPKQRSGRSGSGDDGAPSVQQELLSLFDGTSGGKRLFVITCNDWRDLDRYLLNRPGRFHYHIRFQAPGYEEAKAYFEDQVNPEYGAEIPSAINFSVRAGLNYDCMRAIVMELNMGYTLSEAVSDLNILTADSNRIFSVRMFLRDGTELVSGGESLSLYSSDTYHVWLHHVGSTAFGTVGAEDPDDNESYVCAMFRPIDIRVNENGSLYLPGDYVAIRFDDNWDDDNEELIEERIEHVKRVGVDKLVFVPYTENLHYRI